MKKELRIEGMSCGHCKMRVENALNELEGVSNVAVDLEGKKATLEAADSVTDAALKEAVEEWGYDVVEIK